MILKILWYFFSICLFCLTNIFSQERNVTVKLRIKNVEHLSFICEIKNIDSDTLIFLSNPFIIEGESSRYHKIHPWPGSNFIANVLYFEQNGFKFSFSGDSDIKPKFEQFPDLLLIAPNKSIKIELLIPEYYNQYFDENIYKFWVTLTYGYKSRLEHSLKNCPELLEQYKCAIKTSELFLIDVQETLKINDMKDWSVKISQLLWKFLDKKISSNTVTLK